MNEENAVDPKPQKSVLRPVRIWICNINPEFINCFVVNLVLAKQV